VSAPSAKRATVEVVLAALLWSTAGIGIESANLPGSAIAGWRSLFALPVVGLFAARDPAARAAFKPALRDPLTWLAAGTYATMVQLFVVATTLTGAASAIFLQYTSPVFLMLLAGPLLGEWPQRRDKIAIACAMTGMLCFFADGLDARGLHGKLLALGSALGYGLFPILLRRLQRRGGALGEGAPSLVLPLANLLVFGSVLARGHLATPTDSTSFRLLVFLGVVQHATPYILYRRAIHALPAFEVALLTLLEPLLNPLWVFLFRGTVPTTGTLVGGTVVLTTVVGHTVARARAPRAR
jgi:drug/metabolite transporter (DMT)-like permease